MPDSRALEVTAIRRSVARIVLPYAAFAAAWIVLSDRALEHFLPNQPAYVWYSSVKGVAFVAVTATLLWVLLRMELGHRFRVEQALQATTARLNRAQQVANVGYWSWDIRTNRVEWSDQMFRIFGIEPQGFSGDLQDVLAGAIHPDDRASVEQTNRAVLEGGRPGSLEYRVVHPDGSVRTVWAEGADIEVDAAGTPIALSGIAQDITERKQLEQRLLRVQRTEAVGTLASGIAHDLNNVLTPVRMIAGLLRGSVSSDQDRAMLDTLEQGAQRGSDIIQKLLTFARGAPATRARLSLAHLLREMEKIAHDTFPHDIEVLVHAPTDVWDVQGDATQLHQVLMNLCINARDAMPDGGTLALDAANVSIAPADAESPDAHPGPHVRLTVTDTGVGIARGSVDRIFDPFFTTKDVGKGTGLGLSASLGIIRGHGGFVRVRSEPGQGTTFEVYLPATPPDDRRDAGPGDA
jgi:two-component system cell cycle sensor histidine kinase/response regulator CckA